MLRSRSFASLVFGVSVASVLSFGGCGDESSNDGDGGQGGDDGGSISGRDVFCQSDKDCTDDDKLCDGARGICVDCLQTSDCRSNQLCERGSCVDVTPCDDSRDCSSNQVCDEAAGYCVECVGDNDCNDDQVCLASECRDSCDSDKECTDQGQLCSSELSICVTCIDDGDCDGDTLCEDAECVPAVCNPGTGFCQGDELVLCSDRGDRFETYLCGDECVDDGKVVECEGGATASGGSGSGSGGSGSGSGGTSSGGSSSGGSGTGGGGSGCTSETVNLCTTIPVLSGVQDVDGRPDEFCNVPAHSFTPASAEYVAIETVGIDQGNSVATVRAAWSSLGMHVHVHVADPAVMHDGFYEYDGDNVQIFIAGEAPTVSSISTHPSPTNGGSAQIFIIPPAGGEQAWVEFGYDGLYYERCTGENSATCDYDYAARQVSDGYEVELLWKWPDVVPDSGDAIGFNVQVGVQDVEATGGRDFEYALNLESLTSSGCIGETREAPWCDARHWCTPQVE